MPASSASPSTAPQAVQDFPASGREAQASAEAARFLSPPATASAQGPDASAGQGTRPANGTEPATITVPAAPGKNGPMQVLVAAEVLRRVNRTRQVVSLVSQVIIRSYEEEALEAEVCRHLVTFGGYLMAWVGLAEETPERLIRPVAHSGLEANFLQALKITWSNDLANRSPTSRAIQEQRPHVARNIPKEPRFAVLREEAQLHGYTATCALPLQFAQYGLGVLTIHASEPDAFGPEEVSLLRELANDVAAGVIGLRERVKRQVLEERLAAVIDAAEEAIIGTDFDGVITDWNAGATRLFGFQRDEVVGRPIVDSIVPPERREEAQRVREAIGRGERVPRFETVRRCKEGRAIHTSIMISPIYGGDGAVIGATAVEHDVTQAHVDFAARHAQQLEEMEVAKLKGLEKVRKTFMSEASHELNTPLTPLRIHVEALGEMPDLSPGQRQHLAVIERNVLRLCDLVRDMLEASRLETGRFRLELAEVALPPLLRETVQGLAEQATAAKVTLQVGALSAAMVKADRNRIGQVLYNLLGNAIGFTPPEGTVTVTCTLEDGSAVVRITDSGVGLSAEQIGQLFQPFSRPHERMASPHKGTGLGLFISKGIVEQHGGRIWAESAGPGLGASFAFSLPLRLALPASNGASGSQLAEDRRSALQRAAELIPLGEAVQDTDR